MKILLCKFGGLGENGIEFSLRRKGYIVETVWVKCDSYDYDKEMLNQFSEKLSSVLPDCVFSLNFLPIISKVCNVYKVLYLSWVYDCPEIHLYSKAIHNPVNRIYIFDKILYSRLKQRCQKTIYYMPLATDPVVDFENWTGDDEIKRYSHDVTFIGSLYNEVNRQYHQLNALSGYEKGYVEGLASAQMMVQGYNFILDSLTDSVVKNIKSQLDYVAIDDYEIDDREIIADHYIGMYVSSLERIYTLQKAADVHKLSIYTDSDISMLNNIEHCGIADSVTMTPKIYNLSKVNLNITIKPIQSGIPLRVFDVLGSGGFLITNYQTELSEYFEIGKDLVVYEGVDDLQSKILYYLAHEEERIQIANRGYQKVKENYNYDNMLSLMFEGIEGIAE